MRAIVSRAVCVLVLATAVFGVICGPAMAQEQQFKIGMVDLDKVVREHPVMQKWTVELETLKAEREKEMENSIKEKFGVTNESELSDQQKVQIQRIIMQENQRFAADMEPKQKEKLKQVEDDIKQFGAVIATEKNYAMILDRMVVIYGAIDVTDQIIEKVKAKYEQ
ncbi:MAG TPA: OmpH family outer membrane protein [bacterium]|nr:OmpH family outer membrane protein [bacterium]